MKTGENRQKMENIFLQYMNKIFICPQKFVVSSSLDNIKKMATNKDLTNSHPTNITMFKGLLCLNIFCM